MGTLADAVAAARQDQIAATAKMNVVVRDLQSRAEKAERELGLAGEAIKRLGIAGLQVEAERDEARKAWDQERVLWKSDYDQLERECNGLLARIHRDGGHYTAEVGLKQSIADAHVVWAELVR